MKQLSVISILTMMCIGCSNIVNTVERCVSGEEGIYDLCNSTSYDIYYIDLYNINKCYFYAHYKDIEFESNGYYEITKDRDSITIVLDSVYRNNVNINNSMVFHLRSVNDTLFMTSNDGTKTIFKKRVYNEPF